MPSGGGGQSAPGRVVHINFRGAPSQETAAPRRGAISVETTGAKSDPFPGTSLASTRHTPIYYYRQRGTNVRGGTTHARWCSAVDARTKRPRNSKRRPPPPENPREHEIDDGPYRPRVWSVELEERIRSFRARFSSNATRHAITNHSLQLLRNGARAR